MKLLLLVAGAAARRSALSAAPRALASVSGASPLLSSAFGAAAGPRAPIAALAGVRGLSSTSKKEPKASGGPDGSDSDEEEGEDEEKKRKSKSRAAAGKPQKPRLSLKEQQELDEEDWDEERWGALDSEDWQGFDGDLDAVTAEGVPTWLQSVRDLSAIHDEKRMRAKLARRAFEEAKKNVVRHRKVDELGRAYGTGRRKTSTARVWVKKSAEPLAGRIVVNKKDLVDYFGRDTYREDVLRPFSVVNEIGNFDVYCTVKGGGLTGQAGAVRHGISRALQHFDPALRAPLKKEGLLTRDPRMVERKKPGQPKARKKFQWVKR